MIDGGTNIMYYIHKDYLGSFESVTDDNGVLLERHSFDPWGRRRNATDWTYDSVPDTYTFSRGFTGHEHLDNFDLINMNGRVYDPWLGRMLSPDPFVQAPTYSQNYNRYSYALNNPLKYTDPSGYYYGPAKDIINEGYYDLASQGSYGMDYWRGVDSPMLTNSGFGLPGSGNHWSDFYRSEWGNFMTMSIKNFDNFYGVGSSALVRNLMQYPDAFKQWQTGEISLSDIWEDGGFWVKSSRINNIVFSTGPNDKSQQLQEVEIINKWISVGQSDGGGNEIVSTINMISNVSSLVVVAVSNTITSTRIGSNITYSLLNSKVFLTSVKNLKPFGYGATGVSVLTDVGLSINGQQSWTETGINSGVTIGAMIVGGWYGVAVQLDYQAAKLYLRTTREHPEWVLPASYHNFTH